MDALLLELTPKQKVAQLQSRPGNGIPELAVPAFNWQEECLHGVKAGGPGRVKDKASGTIYPISIAWAAAFDDGLAHTAASQIGDEMRAQYNRRADLGISLAYSNCFGPHVHVARDPRWGRLAETFGEDPLVNANMAVAHVTGLQGGAAADGESYLKTAATCKVRGPVEGACACVRAEAVLGRARGAARLTCPHGNLRLLLPLCSTLSATTSRAGRAPRGTTLTPASMTETCATPGCR